MTTASRQTRDDPVDVLLVEDNPGDVRLVREALKAAKSRARLRSVTDGDEAIDRLREQAADDPASLPDIALLDLKLPGTDGCAVLEAIRDDPELRALPVIVLTGSEGREDIERCYDAHVNAYLRKPTDTEEFTSVVKAVERFWFEQARLPSLA
ncbi:Response regulator receiver domain-containing protein [Halopelagius inordinatus]|uniref:Response regulator receiver domain-containing protein n=1 Tax=Halopelagius inordinatus TaxID=553467 RepID=A0A1I2RMY6_9EURY|nr:response regulator [Halopelagius inordinatus]SFG41820.1 Response regulator receiver domain-containing protein [Halopelagius inordinatus]